MYIYIIIWLDYICIIIICNPCVYIYMQYTVYICKFNNGFIGPPRSSWRWFRCRHWFLGSHEYGNEKWFFLNQNRTCTKVSIIVQNYSYLFITIHTYSSLFIIIHTYSSLFLNCFIKDKKYQMLETTDPDGFSSSTLPFDSVLWFYPANLPRCGLPSCETTDPGMLMFCCDLFFFASLWVRSLVYPCIYHPESTIQRRIQKKEYLQEGS